MQKIRNFMSIAGMLLSMAAIIVSTVGTVQLIMGMVNPFFKIRMTEDELYSLSGTIGVAISSAVITQMNKKRIYMAKQSFSWKTAGIYGVFTLCLCQVIVSVITTVLLARVIPYTITSMEMSDLPWQVDVFFAIAVAPISEELLFRRCMYSRMCEKVNKPIAMVCCSLIFAAMHGYQIQGFLSCFFVGIVLNYIYDRTNNVGYCMIAHMLCNVEVFVCRWAEAQKIMMFGKPAVYEVNGYSTYHRFIFALACMIAMLLAAVIRQQNLKEREKLVKGV